MAAGKRRARPSAGKKKPASKRAPRRRSKFTASRRKAILKALVDGRFRYTAALMVGIGERTLKEWMARGRTLVDAAENADLKGTKIPQVGEFGEFYLDVLKAEAKAEDKALEVITSIALSTSEESRDRLKAATWYLERKHPRRYGSAVKLEHTGKDGGPIEVDARRVLQERLDGMSGRDGGS